ncbi:hypothetical protein Kpol_1000p2 [Vanderwaltozyma polyspora DSM 70294]|uniref:Uncharacterized protein n=1 Tax=Vanderwaltozyma polyspora (strain ATCC 22028 / DSM 70294 / BCRC 21397 / CBS 2163 / NBRC 10782 / NRRL Y-8283 / UCD 57-17) TaxID=436907 RepID=A7TPU4_VANPO|nr:uncharacterized protein Kpol_1000p2 [Vanderwaltozyma polyspora DSM 70294]EDO15692.1 hypothetical protein Kpol_1000p2 [Vanderwaltozyma polyspora DSM 70294]
MVSPTTTSVVSVRSDDLPIESFLSLSNDDISTNGVESSITESIQGPISLLSQYHSSKESSTLNSRNIDLDSSGFTDDIDVAPSSRFSMYTNTTISTTRKNSDYIMSSKDYITQSDNLPTSICSTYSKSQSKLFSINADARYTIKSTSVKKSSLTTGYTVNEIDSTFSKGTVITSRATVSAPSSFTSSINEGSPLITTTTTDSNGKQTVITSTVSSSSMTTTRNASQYSVSDMHVKSSPIPNNSNAIINSIHSQITSTGIDNSLYTSNLNSNPEVLNTNSTNESNDVSTTAATSSSDSPSVYEGSGISRKISNSLSTLIGIFVLTLLI